MENKTNPTIQSIMEQKNMKEKLFQYLKFLKKENFELEMKRNRINNIINNDIYSLMKNVPSKLMQASDNIQTILQYSLPQPSTQNFVTKRSPNKRKLVLLNSNKSIEKSAHVVNPHMVNGHILYTPTINLTRVVDVGDSVTEVTIGQNQENTSVNNNEDSELEETVNINEESSINPQLSVIEELSESSLASTSTSALASPHSTVLSGTFQEVKIYLNQITEEHSKDLKRVKKPASHRRSKRCNN